MRRGRNHKMHKVHKSLCIVRLVVPLALLVVPSVFAQQTQRPARPPRPGVTEPGVQRAMSTVTPTAVFPIEGTPDWQVITEDAVWVANGPKNTIHRLDPKTNSVVAAI